MGLRAVRNRLVNLRADFFCKAYVGHRAHRGVLFQRVAECLSINPGDRLFHELVVKAFVHVDAFDPAAALASVEHRTIKQRVDSRIKISVFPHIAGVFAAKLG